MPNILDINPSQLQTEEQYQQQQFGTPGQQALTIAEGAGQGFAGPIATMGEQALSNLGIPGLSPQEQAARASANPVEHYGSEAVGFGAGALTGTGEAAALSKIGEGATALSGVGKATALARIAQTGIRAGAEMTALQTGDEISKFINQDPNQTLGSAAINVGLSGLIGAGTGGAIGGTAELFKTAANKLGVSKLITDYMAESRLLQEKPDLIQEATTELASRSAETDALHDVIDLKDLPAGEGSTVKGPFKNFPPKPGTPILESSEFANPGASFEKGTVKGPFKNFPPKPGTPLFKNSGEIRDSNPGASFEKGPINNFPPKPGTPLFKNSGEIRDYLNDTQKQADSVGKVALESGQEPPVESQLTPTPALNSLSGVRPTAGQALARWVNQKGAQALAKASGETAAGTVGGLGGFLIGHPLVGAWLGEKVLSPVFTSLAKPLAEQAVNSEAARASVEYLASAVKGESLLSNGIKNMLRTGEIVPKSLMPTEASRDKLDSTITALNNPDRAMQVGGNLGHYLPDHHVAVAALAGSAQGYLGGLKPKNTQAGPFDSNLPPGKAQAAAYNRALDIAQQPLLVLKHAKEGTLLPEDIQTMQALYPGLQSSIAQKLTNEMIALKTEGKLIPYAQRRSIAMLLGSPMDFTMTPQSAQAVIMSAKTPQGAQQQPKRATGAQLKAIGKSNTLYSTPLEQRQMDKRS